MHGISAVREYFQPPDVAGCRIWLRSDLGVRVSGITPVKVTNWENQIADFAAYATQSNSTNQPSRVAGVNGIPAIRFAGTQWLLLSTVSAAFGARTIVIVLQLSSEPHTGYTAMVVTNGGGVAAMEMIFDLSGYQYNSFAADQSGGNMSGFSDTLGTATPHAVVHTWNGAAFTGSLDGVTKSMVSSGAYGAVLASAIGARSDGTFPLNGDLYEIIYWNRVLSSLEQDMVRDYLKQRYGT